MTRSWSRNSGHGVTFLYAFRVALVLLAWCMSEVPAAFSQTPEARPASPALFGGVDRQAGARRLIDMTVSVSNAHDDDLGATLGTPTVAPQTRMSGQYSNLDASLSLAKRRRTSASPRARRARSGVTPI